MKIKILSVEPGNHSYTKHYTIEMEDGSIWNYRDAWIKSINYSEDNITDIQYIPCDLVQTWKIEEE